MRPDPLPGDLPEPLPQVPDDASSLERDAEALRRERRAQARGLRWRRLAAGRTGSGVGAPLVGGVLLVVALFAALPVLLRPDLPDDPPPRPLAAPTVPPGRVGGLLPDVALRTPGGVQLARRARPGVLLLVPTRCGCDDAVLLAVEQAREFTHRVRVVTDGRVEGAEQEAGRLRREVARGLVTSGTDATGALSSAYRAVRVTALVVAADGVVLDVLNDVRPGQRLEPRLSVLRPG